MIQIYVPALRERKDDIILLANNFLEKFRKKHRIDCRVISSGLMTKLLVHDWPGNVRELENSIERAVIFSKGEPLDVVHFESLGNEFNAAEDKSKSEQERLVELEEKYAGSPNTLAMVAKELCVDASTLYRKRKKYGLL